MASRLVELTQVETSLEVTVIISMLSAYAIYAYAPGANGRNNPYSIFVVDADLKDARALLNTDADISGD